jgi:hypothetical protein
MTVPPRLFERLGRQILGHGGVDHQTVEDFERDLSKNLKRLSQQLREGSYRPQAVRRVWVPKPGSSEKRALGVPTVRDRVVQAALRLPRLRLGISIKHFLALGESSADTPMTSASSADRKGTP